MDQVDLNSWKDFEEEVKKADKELAAFRKTDPCSYVSAPLFRGQRKASWKLTTSLERYVKRPVSISQYNRYLLQILPAVEAYTERSWVVERDVKFEHGIMESVPLLSHKEQIKKAW